ncbi:MAG: hypothetical protein D6680_18305 [Cyanobacteria bacterium J007]|nr:MAG: hypothetical protein D6680_18305 [Cyanobacteria bacterium J007]
MAEKGNGAERKNGEARVEKQQWRLFHRATPFRGDNFIEPRENYCCFIKKRGHLKIEYEKIPSFQSCQVRAIVKIIDRFSNFLFKKAKL